MTKLTKKNKHSQLDLSLSPSIDAPPSLPDISSSTHQPFTIPGVALLPSPPPSPSHQSHSHSHHSPTLNRSPSTRSLGAGKARVINSGGSPVGYHKPSSAAFTSPPPLGSSFPKSPSYPTNLASSSSSTNAFARPISTRANESYQSRTGSIASLYPSPAFNPTIPPPPPFLSSAIKLNSPKAATLPSVRKSHKQPPTLNIIVVGATRTGKTSFLKTLLNTVELAPQSNLGNVKQKIEMFGIGSKGGHVKKTRKMESLAVDVLDPVRGEKFTLMVIDTPGLDIPMGPGRVGDELEVDRNVGEIIKTLESKFEDTVVAEGNLFRHSHRTHDAHVHLAIYLIHPESIFGRQSSSKSTSSKSTKKFGMSGGGEEVEDDDEEEEEEDSMGVSEVDLRCIKRLSRRVNVLPVLSRTDELTTSQLQLLKNLIKRDLASQNLSFATFSSSTSTTDEEGKEVEDDQQQIDNDEDDYGSDEPSPTKKRAGEVQNGGRGRSGTLTGGGVNGEGGGGLLVRPPLPTTLTTTTTETVATNGHSLDIPLPPSSSSTSEIDSPTLGRADLDPETSSLSPSLSPSASAPIKLIRLRSLSRKRGSRVGKSISLFGGDGGEEWEGEKWDLPFALVTPDGLGEGKEVTREFRYGTLNVLNENHSDFVKLKNGILGSQMRALKESTRQEKYEPFRTQRLLARRNVKTGTNYSVRSGVESSLGHHGVGRDGGREDEVTKEILKGIESI